MDRIRSCATVAVAVAALALAGCQSAPRGSPDASDALSTSVGQSSLVRPVADRAVQELTIRPGTVIEVRLADPLGSARDMTGETFQATLAEPLMTNGVVVAPRGTSVTGRVLRARSSGHLKTPAELAVTLTSLETSGKSYALATSTQSWRGRSHKKRDAEWIGGAASAGALIGALVGHGKGAAIGAGIGAGGGTATAYATGKKDIYLPSETRLRFVLREPVTVTRGS